MKTSLLLAALTTAALLPTTVSAGFVSATGTTTTARTFNRPTETGVLSLYEAVPYDPYVFTVSQSGAYTLTLASNDSIPYDTFLHLYQGSFNAAAPDINFLAANDDSAAGSTTNSGLFNITLTAGAQYVFVADGFDNTEYGGYVASINGPGNISLAPYVVPEPGAGALLATALLGGGVALVVRRRRAAAPRLA